MPRSPAAVAAAVFALVTIAIAGNANSATTEELLTELDRPSRFSTRTLPVFKDAHTLNREEFSSPLDRLDAIPKPDFTSFFILRILIKRK